jgi:deoxyhypusine synthase
MRRLSGTRTTAKEASANWQSVSCCKRNAADWWKIGKELLGNVLHDQFKISPFPAGGSDWGDINGFDQWVKLSWPKAVRPFYFPVQMKKAKRQTKRPEDLNAALARKKGPVSKFIARNYRHFNAAALLDTAKGFEAHLAAGGQMLVTLAGAMSTAELGLTLAEMIRRGKVGAIVCTGANLEEDIFNLVAHDYYERVTDYRTLTAADEQALLDRHMNRVTDTCIPEGEAMRRIEAAVAEEWAAADQAGEHYFPHEFMYKILRSGKLKQHYQIDPKNSWMLAACERNLPIFVPGWEDSTLANMYAGRVITGEIKHVHTVRTGIEYMARLADWYTKSAKLLRNGEGSIGFFQIGGGIAGDFPICVVPMLHQDLGRTTVPLWGYFAQISDSTTSYGSYSGAVPNEKITWGKLGAKTPKFIVESDATIVAPLIFSWVLGK